MSGCINVTSVLLLSAAVLILNSCKLRGGPTPESKNPSDVNASNAKVTDPSEELLNAPIFLKCTTSVSEPNKVELSIQQVQKSGAARMTYRFGSEQAANVNGRWDNFDESAPYQYIYSFGELRFILTNEQFVSGSLPGTLLGTDASGKYREQTLQCSKS